MTDNLARSVTPTHRRPRGRIPVQRERERERGGRRCRAAVAVYRSFGLGCIHTGKERGNDTGCLLQMFTCEECNSCYLNLNLDIQERSCYTVCWSSNVYTEGKTKNKSLMFWCSV